MQRTRTEFGIAMRNFTRFPDMPSAKDLIEYGVRMDQLGFESVWAWDHILLGVDPNFPIQEALLILTASACPRAPAGGTPARPPAVCIVCDAVAAQAIRTAGPSRYFSTIFISGSMPSPGPVGTRTFPFLAVMLSP